MLLVSLINLIEQPTWLASIVPIRKKNGQINIYNDFHDLNKDCLKDEIPLLSIDMLVDAIVRIELYHP